jgi:hypothetical protein
MAPGPLRAGVVEHALTDILPDRVRTVEPGGVRRLDLNGPCAAAADNPQNMLRNLAQPRPDTCCAWARRTRVGDSVVQDGLPVFRRHLVGRTDGTRRAGLPADGSRRQFFHLFGCRHAPAGGSVGHTRLEHNKNKRVESVKSRKSKKNDPQAKRSVSDQGSPFVLNPASVSGVPPWPPALTGKAFCAFRSSPVP